MDLSVIILNWNAASDTLRCVCDLAAWQRVRATIWVVDNASTDGSADIIERECPQVRLIRNPVNLGFAGGNNRGLSEAINHSTAPILLLNNDAAIAEDDIISLLETLTTYPSVGIVGPLLFDAENRNRLLTAGGQNMVRHLKSHTTKTTGEPVQIVDYVPGTVLLARAEVFHQAGLLDEDYFFNGETPDLCWRAKQFGYLSAVDTQARAYHALERSSKFRETLYTYYIIRNRFLFIRKFYRPFAKILLFSFWVFYSLALATKLRLDGKAHAARAVWLGLQDSRQNRFGGQNERVLAACSVPVS